MNVKLILIFLCFGVINISYGFEKEIDHAYTEVGQKLNVDLGFCIYITDQPEVIDVFISIPETIKNREYKISDFMQFGKMENTNNSIVDENYLSGRLYEEVINNKSYVNIRGSLGALKKTMITVTYEEKDTDYLSYHIKLWNFFDDNNRIDYGELPECMELKNT